MTEMLRLGDIVTIERGTTYKSALLGQPGPVLLGLGTIQRHGGFRGDSLRTYGGESPAKLLVHPNGLYASLKDVTQTADLLGAVAKVPGNGPVGRLTQDTVRLDLHSEKVSVDYLYWMLRTPQYRDYCRSHATGTTTMGLPREDFFAFQFPAPNDARVLLVRALGVLDDKIAANSNLRALADELCRAIFRRLTANRDVGELSSIATVNAIVAKPRTSGTLRYVDISAVGQGVYNFPERSSWSEAPGRARRVVRPGDTIWSTVRPNRRSHALVLDEDSSLIASTGLAVLTPQDGRIAGLYEASRTGKFVEYLESVAEGSAYPAVRADRFNKAPVPALRPEEWSEFEQVALPLRQRAHAADVESRNLRAARDELLPLLMTGRIRVRDAERQVEDAL